MKKDAKYWKIIQVWKVEMHQNNLRDFNLDPSKIKRLQYLNKNFFVWSNKATCSPPFSCTKTDCYRLKKCRKRYIFQIFRAINVCWKRWKFCMTCVVKYLHCIKATRIKVPQQITSPWGRYAFKRKITLVIKRCDVWMIIATTLKHNHKIQRAHIFQHQKSRSTVQKAYRRFTNYV